jgi:hypothetical protein
VFSLILISNFSQVWAIDNNNNTDKILPPLKQWKSGIESKEVECKHNLQLIIKQKNDSPACVKPDRVLNLISSAWILPFDTEVQHFNLPVKYGIFNGELEEVKFEQEGISLSILIHSASNGYLYIEIPPELLKTMFGKCDQMFFVLVNEKETFSQEIIKNTSKLLQIPLTNDTKIIQILGTATMPECFG